jgi:hypothetical protein
MGKEHTDNIFSDTVSDLKISKIKKDRDLENELFGKKGIQEKIDALEESLGFGKGEKIKSRNLKFHHKLLNPSHDEDEQLLNELLNDKYRFNIIMWKDTWTVHGEYKVFVIYSEDLDVKKEEDKNTEKDDNE